MADKYTKFVRQKTYAPDKNSVNLLTRIFGGKKVQDSPKGKGGKTDA